MWGCEQVGLSGWIFLFPLPAMTVQANLCGKDTRSRLAEEWLHLCWPGSGRRQCGGGKVVLLSIPAICINTQGRFPTSPSISSLLLWVLPDGGGVLLWRQNAEVN